METNLSVIDQDDEAPSAATPAVNDHPSRTVKWWVAALAVVASLLAGGVIGVVVGMTSQQGTIDDLEAANAALAGDKSALESDNDELTDERDALTAKRDQLQAQVDDREAQRAADDAAVARIAAEKDKKERDRIAAEQKKAADDAAAAQAAAEQAAADQAAAEAERNTIGGDGIYAIGPEKAPGRYRTPGPSRSNCYYAVLRAPNGEGVENIIDNNNVAGPAIVDLRSGQFLESSGCQTWTRV